MCRTSSRMPPQNTTHSCRKRRRGTRAEGGTAALVRPVKIHHSHDKCHGLSTHSDTDATCQTSLEKQIHETRDACTRKCKNQASELTASFPPRRQQKLRRTSSICVCHRRIWLAMRSHLFDFSSSMPIFTYQWRGRGASDSTLLTGRSPV